MREQKELEEALRLSSQSKFEEAQVITQEISLKEGLKQIASWLEQGEMYVPSKDNFIRGDEMNRAIVDFATKLATDRLPNWIIWIEKRGISN